MNHQEQDKQSLALHTETTKLMREDERLIRHALDILSKWDETCDALSKPLRDEWVRILRERDWKSALATTERGYQLRQASPVACVFLA